MYNLGQHFINQPQNLISNPETIFVGSKYRITVLTDDEILNAIEKGDKQSAAVCMRDHIDNQQLAVIRKIK